MPMFQMLVIPADEEAIAYTVSMDPAEMDLWQFFQSLVGGDLEPVKITEVFIVTGPELCRCTMYVNQEGKPRGLPVNPRATTFSALTTAGEIVGDVVIVGPWRRRKDTPVPKAALTICSDFGWRTAATTMEDDD